MPPRRLIFKAPAEVSSGLSWRPQARRQDARWRAAKPHPHLVSDRRTTTSALDASRADEYWVDHPLRRAFVGEAKAIIFAWHHTCDLKKGTIHPFRSGYTNAECEDESDRPGPS
jgi:hypothetical protein